LHGRLEQVRCLHCDLRLARSDLQFQLAQRNRSWESLEAAMAPDGDADLQSMDFEHFEIPACPACDGMLKPDVVFFGESVPVERVHGATTHLGAADAML